MAFQGAQNQPDLVGLALNLMQMRRDRELAERKMALEEGRLRFDQQQSAIQAARDAEDWKLAKMEREAKLKEQGFNLNSAFASQDQGIGQLLASVNSPDTPAAERNAAVSALNQYAIQQDALGRDMNQVGGNWAAGLSSAGQAGRMKENEQRTTSDIAVDEFRRKAAIEERITIRQEKRKQALEAAQAQGGVLDEKQLATIGSANHTELQPAYENQKAWNLMERFDPNNRADIVRMMNYLQRSIDPAVVRSDDINLWNAVGVKDWEGWKIWVAKNVNKRMDFAPGFGELLKNSLRSQLEASDEKIDWMYTAQEDVADDLDVTPAQKAILLRDKRIVQKVRDRIKSRGGALARDLNANTPPTSSGPPAGSKPHPTVPGLWVKPDGSGWMP